MHIAEGVLSPGVLAGGWALAAVGVGIGVRRLDHENIPRAAVLASAFFVASLVRMPLGITSAHLVLNGLAGLVLGWAAFPAIAVALFLQTVLFAHGGLTPLGVNIFVMGFPAVLVGMTTGALVRRSRTNSKVLVLGAISGGLAILLACTLQSMALWLSDSAFLRAAELNFVAHLPVVIVEAVVTGFGASFLYRVHPEMLRMHKVSGLSTCSQV